MSHEEERRRARRREATKAGKMALGIALALGIAGCGLSVDSVRLDKSASDRCADFMRQAFPDSEIEVTHATSGRDPDNAASTGAVASVEGFRKNIAPGAKARDVAVECKFTSGILTGFRWTKGPL
jgi:hypothetical protein